ncbi:YjbF family lipoprotein [Marinomonas pontica]|uniref:YjbF family lipoprotein n=1 Tax=Marinomonas pontica TaxID=264739 RepID=UPI0022445028|nr:YjbF family lipoprotein [Marinomonas pontica]MCW8354496.1 YjbF family lipoprotein [Marinomonas pontica]
MDSIKAAKDVSNGPDITSDYITSLPYASTLVRINNSKPILLILSFIDQNPISGATRLTWISGDKGSITTENGRIIQTTGFYSNNLDGLMDQDKSLSLPNRQGSWQAIYDWSPGYRYHFSAQVSSHFVGNETITTDLWVQAVEHIEETAVFSSLSSQFTNHFWVVPATDDIKAFVVKSIQYLGPNMDKVEMLMIKPFIEPILQNESVEQTQTISSEKSKKS